MTEKIPKKKREEIYSWKYDITTEPTDKATQMLKLSHIWKLWLDYAYFVYNYAPKKRERYWAYMAFISKFYEVYNMCKKEKRLMTFKNFEMSPSELLESHRR